MNYQRFNDAMIRLRQAEENMHLAMQDCYSAIEQALTEAAVGRGVEGKEGNDIS